MLQKPYSIVLSHVFLVLFYCVAGGHPATPRIQDELPDAFTKVPIFIAFPTFLVIAHGAWKPGFSSDPGQFGSSSDPKMDPIWIQFGPWPIGTPFGPQDGPSLDPVRTLANSDPVRTPRWIKSGSSSDPGQFGPTSDPIRSQFARIRRLPRPRKPAQGSQIGAHMVQEVPGLGVCRLASPSGGIY